jgi:hypothetical protein
MNKRIKELAEQSYERKQSMVIDPNTYEMVPGKTYSKDLNQEKFAELIAQECIHIAYRNNNSGEGGVIADNIKEHFGIES